MVLFMYFLTLVAAIHPANNPEHVDQLVATKLQLKIKQLDNSHKSNPETGKLLSKNNQDK